MPWPTQPPYPKFAVGPLLIYPYEGPSGTQLVYMNVMHTDSQLDVLYSPSLLQDAALASPKANGSPFDEGKIYSAKQNKANLNMCTPCNSMKHVVISPAKDEQDSDFSSVTNRNTSPVVKSEGSNHDSFASEKQTCNMILTNGTNSLRTGSEHRQMDAQYALTSEECFIKENEEIRNKKRKQSNRESARRSRLRKQEECQKLQDTVNLLVTQISKLKRQLMNLSEDCGELYEENQCIEEEIIATHGEDAISDLKAVRPASVER